MILLNGRIIEVNRFPNGELRIEDVERKCYRYRAESIDSREPISEYDNIITLKYESDLDFINLYFVKRHLDDMGYKSILTITYMPYSRMDRVPQSTFENIVLWKDTAFTLKYISELINNLNFENVFILEPHSDVTLALINRSKAIYPTKDYLRRVTEEVSFNDKTDFLFFPDAGAQKRYSDLRGYNYLVGFKKRDFMTGNIVSFEVLNNGNVDGGKVIIIDDLCSRGGTFVESAKKLREIGFKEVYLFVTHCENSIFEGGIYHKSEDGLLNSSGIINKIFTTDSILSKEDPTGLIKIFETKDIFRRFHFDV